MYIYAHSKVVLPILLGLVALIAFGGFVLITALDPRRGSVFIFILRARAVDVKDGSKRQLSSRGTKADNDHQSL